MLRRDPGGCLTLRRTGGPAHPVWRGFIDGEPAAMGVEAHADGVSLSHRGFSEAVAHLRRAKPRSFG